MEGDLTLAYFHLFQSYITQIYLIVFKICWNFQGVQVQVAPTQSFFHFSHSVPKPFNKLGNLENKLNQFSLFNKISLQFMVRGNTFSQKNLYTFICIIKKKFLVI